MSEKSVLGEYEEASGRATRTRTRLIVEGYSNLALIAILFTGVQAQLISTTNGQNESALDKATNAVFFGGLMFSVFTAVLAVLSGRWFSILREDDSDYLSSRWLAQDCADIEPGHDKDRPTLDEYVRFQIDELQTKLDHIKEPHSKRNSTSVNPASGQGDHSKRNTTSTNPDASGDGPQVANQASEVISTVAQTSPRNPAHVSESASKFDPNIVDIQHIIMLLKQELLANAEESRPSSVQADAPTRCIPKFPGRLKRLEARESMLSLALLSPLGVAVPAFALFCTGILMLTWNRQPLSVAIFTSITVFICVVFSGMFFLKHRRKHVIRKLHLKRPAV